MYCSWNIKDICKIMYPAQSLGETIPTTKQPDGGRYIQFILSLLLLLAQVVPHLLLLAPPCRSLLLPSGSVPA